MTLPTLPEPVMSIPIQGSEDRASAFSSDQMHVHAALAVAHDRQENKEYRRHVELRALLDKAESSLSDYQAGAPFAEYDAYILSEIREALDAGGNA